MAIKFDSPQTVLDLLADLPHADEASMQAATAHQQQLTKPPGSLGRLEEIAIWLAGWQQKVKPSIAAPHCLVFAGNHGLANNQPVSAYPPQVTAQMLANFKQGGAAINQLTQALGVPLHVHALDLATPTEDITLTSALSIDATLAAMQGGADAIPEACDMLLLGEMGIGNTSIASALALATLGGVAADWAGIGSGLDKAGVARKAQAIAQAVRRHQNQTSPTSKNDPTALIASLGGRELAAIAGATLAARTRRIPVLLDGFIATCAVLPLWQANPLVLAHCRISHQSAEAAHGKVLAAINAKPLFNLDMRLGEASGAAVAFGLVKLALAVHNGMANFADAGVATKAR